jgi:hypothetical protein
VSFAAITLCVASQRRFIVVSVYFVIDSVRKLLDTPPYSSTHSLTSALDGGEWSASSPGCFTPRETAPGTHWIGGWVGTRAGLGAVKRKIPSPRRVSNPISCDRPARTHSLYRLSYPGSLN